MGFLLRAGSFEPMQPLFANAIIPTLAMDTEIKVEVFFMGRV